MDLFDYLFHEKENRLPYDGEVYYIGAALDAGEASRYFQVLTTSIAWKQDLLKLFGRQIATRRETAWYGDHNFTYQYSGMSRKALPWTKELADLKKMVEKQSGEEFNSCLLNNYHSGEEGMGWHRDNEKELKPDGTIVSLSLGAERKFRFKHLRTGEIVNLILNSGSLLLMKGVTQQFWVHELPKTKRIKTPRINLTFRTVTSRESPSD